MSTFPALNGRFAVGLLHLDPVSLGKSGHVGADLFYPAADRPRTPVARFFRSHAQAGVTLTNASTRFPVVFYCPGWCGTRHEATFLCQDLASHGYIVVSLDHPVAPAVDVSRDRDPLARRWVDFTSVQTFAESVTRLERVVETQLRNVRVLLDHLAAINRSDPQHRFTGRLDLDCIGILGYSFGGAVAAEACRRDARFRAGINMDGILFGPAALEGIPKPFLFFSSSEPLPDERVAGTDTPAGRAARFILNDYRNILNSLARYGGYYLLIHGTGHGDFCDSPLYSRVRRFAGVELIPPHRTMKIIAAYTAEFFAQFLWMHEGLTSLNIRQLAPAVLSHSDLQTVNLRIFPGSAQTRPTPPLTPEDVSAIPQ